MKKCLPVYRCQPVIFLLVISLICCRLGAQSVRGLVVDAVSREPLPGAVIQKTPDKYAVFTDAEGRFAIQAAAGSLLKISFTGYASLKFTF